jgi:hypothetical protein
MRCRIGEDERMNDNVENWINRNCSDNSIYIINQSKEHKILAEKFKIDESICLILQNLSIPHIILRCCICFDKLYG